MLTYTYDALGRETSAIGPGGTTRYAYDARSRLVTVTDPSGGVFSLGHDALSRLTSIQRPNGVVDTLTYDAAGELLSRDASLNGTALAESEYTYDAGGRRVSMTDL